MKTGKPNVHVVPHSHWDREWYFTIEDSNVLLVENLDRLLDVLEGDPTYVSYVFDGQVSIVEEYLKIRPEERDRMKRFITERRLFVGPWYTQTDTLLVNRESIIRNLLYGTRIAKAMGHSMNVGYLPDIFGQNAYLPSFFKDFGIDYSVLQRGIYHDEIKGDLNFHWQSPDGARVKTNYIFFGYGPGKFLEATDAYKTERLDPILKTLESMNRSTDELLLPSGGDQVLVREHFPEAVRRLNEMDRERTYQLSDYETFMEAAFAREIPNTIEGELIASQKSRMHHTIRSQRVDLKQGNYAVETKLIDQLEPLGVIAESLGFRYPKAWINQVWKELFDVHSHDSIGGCNSDATNDDIKKRIEKCERIVDGLINLLKKQIARAVDVPTGELVLFFNYVPKQRTLIEDVVVFTNESDVGLVTFDGDTVNTVIREQSYVSGGKKIVVTADGEKEVEVPGYYRTVLAAEVTLPSLGYAAYRIVNETKATLGATDVARIENDQLAVTFAEGRVTMKAGTHDVELFTFEDTADTGDSYDYSPLVGETPITTAQAELIDVSESDLVSTMTVKHTWSLPIDLEARGTDKLKQQTIVTKLEVRQGEAFVRVNHEIDNDVKDHRVRVLFPWALERTFADQAYTALERKQNPRATVWKEEKYAEKPVSIYPLENYVVAEGGAALGVITQGLKEYEHLDDGLALTLFRSVGLLGKDNLAWRPGRASGINNKVVETPDAQMLGHMSFDYAVGVADCFDAVDWTERTETYKANRASYHKQSLNTFEERLERFEIPQPVDHVPATYSLLTTSHFVSAIKQGADGGRIVRLFNPSSEDVPLHIETAGTIQHVSLAEIEVDAQDVIKAHGYTTLHIKEETS
ncbi:glycoside hydrolase family 38 C-terminal domain-containing protein [Exiguobacterium marinum]|uniref:Glycoside hydrolase family 38 C-terminal domain-containing protein n=1 Tax=Exiguobacterium marinum TaxID=273528 RepID=A0ABY7X0C8_9BACL|nr:glycoside hydrolase family 38 C-terminal domain-containing protein [Exiguobacterium marinum]WDH75450.1 glycoside hydrolase family 38 C-terminal domain-containing protein [Exiguobacterium marinum]